MFDGKDLRKAWARQGDAGDRSEEVEEVMSAQEEIGYEEGLPLADCEYEDYPSGDELLRPGAKEVISALVDHELIASTEDLSRELDAREEHVTKALGLFGLEEPSGFEVEVDSSRLDALMGNIPDRLVAPDNALVVATLYVEKGLSVSEVRDVLDEATNDNTAVTEKTVKQTLVDARVIDGLTSEQREQRWKESRGEVNRASDGGMTINTEDY